MISTFVMIQTVFFKEIPAELTKGTVLRLKKHFGIEEHKIKKGYCIVSDDFMEYITLVSRINSGYIKVDNYEERNEVSIDEYLDRDFMSSPLMSFSEAISKLIFVEMSFHSNEENGGYESLIVETVYSSSELWEYWIPRNTYNNPEDMQHIGLGKKIYDLVAPNHHYFDMSWVCSCGDIDCYNYIPLYIRHQDNYTVGFIVNRFHLFEFNSKHENFKTEVYAEEVEKRKLVTDRNIRLELINEFMNVTENGYHKLSTADRLLVDKGEMADKFPYLYEREGSCLYKPLLGDNKDLPFG